MKKIFYTFLLISPLLFISSCKEDVVHGCLDSYATNYNDNANIDNNSCCYDCYIGATLHGNFCGPEALEIESNGASEYSQLYLNGIPQFDATGMPVMQWVTSSVDCVGL